MRAYYRRRRTIVALLLGAAVSMVVAMVMPGVVQAQPPTDYYAGTEGLEGEGLRQALHDIIKGHTVTPYSSPSSFDIIAELDADPGAPGFVRTIYKNAQRPAARPNPADWHREHSWPKSYGFSEDAPGKQGPGNVPLADFHALFAADPGYNQSRSNSLFGFCLFDCTQKAVDDRDGMFNLRQPAKGDVESVWEVWPERRGDIARAQFYMDVRYDGTPAVPGTHEPDLILTDDDSLVVETDSSPAYMGRLCDLLLWHKADPGSTPEALRNNGVYNVQGNRNPFVDHPEFVAKLWGCPIVYLPSTHNGASTPPDPTPVASAAASSTPLPPTTAPEPSVTSTAQPSSTATPSASPTATSVSSSPTATLEPQPASLVIGELQCASSHEYLRVENTGAEAVQLGGWGILSVVGPQEFMFPSYVLEPGASVFVDSGPDAPETGGNRFRWTTGNIWNNSGDTAELMRPAGDVVDSKDC